MVSWWTTEQSIRAGETWNWPKLCKSQNSNFNALLCLIFFTLSLELLNGLRSAVGLTQRIPPFGDKLRHGLILWPKLPASSSNTVSEKWRQQRFNRRFALHFEGRFTPRQRINHIIQRLFDPAHLPHCLTSDMACRFKKTSQDLPGCKD